MPLYSDDIREEVRSRSDIVDVVSQYVKLHKRGATYVGLCPFHNEKTPSFTVTPGKQMYYCFGCGAGGDVFSFLMNYENASFAEAMQELAERAGVSLPVQEPSREARAQADRRSRLLEVNKEAAAIIMPCFGAREAARLMNTLKTGSSVTRPCADSGWDIRTNTATICTAT
jgi:DNA primase